MKNKKLLNIIEDKLQNSKFEAEIIAGFDGYIDEIIHVVDKRISNDKYDRMYEMTDFAERIRAAAGLSANFELISKQLKLGGNGPIYANALLNQNHKITYFGSLGETDIHPIFEEFVGKCDKVYSWCNPGHTQAIEFSDGKIMIGKAEHLGKISWENMLNNIDKNELALLISSIDLIAITNWNALMNLNTIFIGINDLLKQTDNRPKIFIDLADPAKRTSKDIKELLSIISDLNKNGSVIFGLNKNESRIIAENLDIVEDNVIERTTKIRAKMEIDYVVVHPLEGAVCASNDSTKWVDGPYTNNPKMTTGAGDNFNSGFCNGILLNMSIEESLAVGVMTSGYYVRKCASPSRKELVDFIESWKITI